MADALGLSVAPSNRRHRSTTSQKRSEKTGALRRRGAPHDGGCRLIEGKYYHVPGPYTSKPKLTTGAATTSTPGFAWGRCWGSTRSVAGRRRRHLRILRAQSQKPHGSGAPGFLRTWAQNFGTEF